MPDTRAARVLAGIILALFACLLGEAHAHACKPKFSGEASLGRVYWSEAAKVELRDEQVELDCYREQGNTRCRWQGSYAYASESGAPAMAEFVVGTPGTLLSASVHVESHGEPARELELEPNTQRVVFELASTRRVIVVAQVELLLDTDYVDACLPSAAFVRHRVVPRPEQRLVIDAVPADPPHADAMTSVRIRGPRGWTISAPQSPDDELARGSRRTEPQLSLRAPSRELSRVAMDRRSLMHGPFAAAGLGFGPQLRARMRVGYELAKPEFLIYSAAVEGDLVETLLFVPAVEIASPGPFLVFPSVGVGLGLPIQALPDARAGLRLQGAMQWSYAGLVGSVDIYPATAGDATAVRGALMIQLSI